MRRKARFINVGNKNPRLINPWASLDGSLNAPAGTPQYPHLLDINSSGTQTFGSTYVTRPPWKAAGIDYAVGIDRNLYPTNANLKNPAPGGVLDSYLSSHGGSISGTQIFIGGAAANNIVIDGYDFSLVGYGLNIGTCSNVTVSNCYFVGNTDAHDAIILQNSLNGVTITGCEANGNNFGIGGYGIIECNAYGTTTIQYCYLYNAMGEAIVFGTSSGGNCTHLTQFNLIKNSIGLRTHGDWVQEVQSGSGQICNSSSYNFNTVIQNLSPASSQGWSILSANQALPGEHLAVNILNNTYICIPPGNQPNYIQLVNNTGINGPTTITNNYADMTAVNAGWLFWGPDVTSGAYNGTLVSFGNRNLKTGGNITGAVDNPWANLDGSLNAPTGTPQYPHLLDLNSPGTQTFGSTYVIRPPWKVAGVDYAVGIDRNLYPTNANLKDPNSNPLTGVTFNTSSHVATVTSNNVTVDGYDFSLNNGWELVVNTANCTVKNCYFKGGANLKQLCLVSNSASNTTITQNEFDGNGANFNCPASLGGCGSTAITITYNYFHDASTECYQAGENTISDTDNWVLKYNIIANAGWNWTAHADWIQSFNSNGINTNSLVFDFNLVLQSLDVSVGPQNPRAQGLSLWSANTGTLSGGCHIEEVNNNCFVVTPVAYINYAIIMDTSRLINSGTIQDNYLDPSGVGTAAYGGGNWDFVGSLNGGNGGPYNGTVTKSGNINMVSGATLI